MKPVDHVTPTVPSNWVRRVEDKRRHRDPKQDRQPQKQLPNPGPNSDPDGRTHLIDDLA